MKEIDVHQQAKLFARQFQAVKSAWRKAVTTKAVQTGLSLHTRLSATIVAASFSILHLCPLITTLLKRSFMPLARMPALPLPNFRPPCFLVLVCCWLLCFFFLLFVFSFFFFC